MFGLHMNEIIVTLIIALIIFGPQRLPEIARNLGKAIREFRDTSNQITEEFRRATDLNPQPEPPASTVPHVAPAPVSEASMQAPVGMAAATIAAETTTTPASATPALAPVASASIWGDADVSAQTSVSAAPVPAPVVSASVWGDDVSAPVSEASMRADSATVADASPIETTNLADAAPVETVDTTEMSIAVPSSEVSEPVIPAAVVTETLRPAEKDATDTDNDKSPPTP